MNSKTTLAKGLLLFVLLVSACKKDENLHDQSNIVHGKLKEEQVQFEGDLKFQYHYDNDQTLNKQELWADGMLVASNEYRYLNGKLYFRTYSTYAGEKALKVISVSKYTYTGDLLTTVVENVLERHGAESDIITNFTYTEDGLIKSARKWNINEYGVPIVVESAFTTGVNGNIIKISEVTTTRGVRGLPSVYTMKYDDKRNPRYGLIDPLEFTEYFSPNNVVDLNEKTSSGEKLTQFRYEYNADRLPTSVDANDLLPAEFRELVKWVYY